MKKILLISICSLAFQSCSVLSSQSERGSLTVFTGSMCSGKSGELINAATRIKIAEQSILVCKPAIDTRALSTEETRNPITYIPSRNGTTIDCVPVTSPDELEAKIEELNPLYIAIDEAHFFTPQSEDFFRLIKALVSSGKKILISGLDVDFRGEPFGPMPALLAYADKVVKLKAICKQCKQDAHCISQRLVNGKPAGWNDPLIQVGAEESYEPRCKQCHEIRKD